MLGTPRWKAVHTDIHLWSDLRGAASPSTTGVVQATHRMSPLDRKLQQWHI